MGSPVADLVELLALRAEASPSALAFRFLSGEGEGEALSYAELELRARRVAGALAGAGVGQGDRVALLYPPGPDYVAGFFGCLYAGVVAVPAYPPDPGRLKRTQAALRSIAQDAQPKAVLTDATTLPRRALCAGAVPVLESVPWLATDALGEAPAPRPSGPGGAATAFLLYTSGSTGAPKGVVVTHRSLMENLARQVELFQVGPETVGVSWLPLYHDLGLVMGMLHPVYAGFPSAMLTPLAFMERPARWLQAISRYRGTLTYAPNFAYELVVRRAGEAELAGLDLSCWRVALNGAEPVRPRTLQRFTERLAPHGFSPRTHYPAYGMTEATCIITGGPVGAGPVVLACDKAALAQGRLAEAAPGAEATPLVGCGKALPGQQVRIVEPEAGRECAEGEVGEVWLGGPSNAAGYWNRPEESAATFGARLASGEGPFLRTGDLGALREGELFLTGRLKDLIIIDGANVYPQDLELTAEQSHPAVRAGCGAAFAVEGGEGEQVALVLEADPRADLAAVASAVRAALSEQHAVPLRALALVAPGSVGKTSSGKIQRRAAKAAFLEGRLELLHLWQAGAAASGAAGGEALPSWLRRRLGELVGVPAEQVDPARPFAQQGLTSLGAVTLAAELSQRLGRSVPATALYDHPSVDALARALSGGPSAAPSATQAVAPGEPIAVVGMACRFPGAPDLGAYWRLLREGRDAVGEVPPGRWDATALYDPDPAAPGKMSTRWGGFLEGVDRFDADFFQISPREGAEMDPQQRLLLEVAWEALEDAGLAPDRLAGTEAGVFVGVTNSDYARLLVADLEAVGAHVGTGGSLAIAANRLSYQLDLRGPSLAVDTACSSSLVSVHLACEALRAGRCGVALAGGSNLVLTPEYTVYFSKAGLMAKDGRCKAFDARADGFVRGEGAGLVVLKPLSRALADGDRIYALVRGSAVNQDGRSNGLTAPSGAAQEAVLRAAYGAAGVEPGSVQYVEAHGTGTALGDPIEARALGAVLGAGRPAGQSCALGSVKTNLGHLEAAAGVAGLIKVALSLHHRELPASLHFQQANPLAELESNRLRVQTALGPWPGSGPARAGVSSFGFGGTNAHAVLEAAPARPAAPAPEGEPGLLLLSAATPAALRQQAERVRAALPGLSWRDACHTAATGRTGLAHRLALVARSSTEAASLLGAQLAGEEQPAVRASGPAGAGRPRVAFVFSGHGGQWAGMGRRLLERPGAFREALLRCEAAIRVRAGFSVTEVLTRPEAEARLNDFGVVQPVIFALQVALAEQLRAWGLQPGAVAGHSMGEVAAACVAGALELEEGLRVICERSRLLAALPPQGAMLAVELTPEQARARLADLEGRVELAAHNGPSSVVLAGERGAVEALRARLEGEGVFARPVAVSLASHCHLVEPVRAPLEQALAGLAARAPAIPLYSTVRPGGPLAEAPDAAYWWQNLRRPVGLAPAVSALLRDGFDTLVELGPHPVLVPALRQALVAAGRPEAGAVATLRRGEDDLESLLGCVAALEVRGVALDRAALCPGQTVDLPTYPFQRERHWLERAPRRARAAGHPLLGEAVPQPREAGWLWQVALGPEVAGLGDHRVEGVPVLPAAAYLELALAGAAQVLGAGPREVVGLQLARALTLDRPRRLEVTLQRDGRFAVHAAPESGEGEWTALALGRVQPASGSDSGPEDGAATLAEVAPEAFYRAARERGLDYGPAFQGVRSLSAGAGRARGQVALEARPSGYLAPPALLDSVLQLGLAALAPGAGTLLPTGVGVARLHRALGRTLSVRASVRPGGAALDLWADDESGRVLELLGVELSPVGGARAGAVPLWELAWDERPRPTAPASRGSWAVLGEGALAEALRARLRARGDACAGSLAEAASGPVSVVDLRALSAPEAEPADGAAAAAEATARVTSAAELVQALAGRGAPVRLWLVTRGAQASGAPGLPQSPLWGLGRTARRELPDLRCTLVDLAEPDLEALWSELGAEDGEGQLAWRAGRRFGARLRPGAPDARRPSALVSPGATYLITGGLGGLGLAFAGWLADRGAESLALLGRSAPGPEAERAVAALRARGVRVALLQADVADRAALQTALAPLRAGPQPLRGVLHAAGVLADRTLSRLSRSEVEAAMAPKVAGGWNLHLLTRDLELSWFVLFSSAAGLLGSPGQAAYASANAWLDALAERRRAQGLPAVSVAWGAFRGAGAADREDRAGRLEAQGFASLTLTEGPAALEAVLGSGAVRAAPLRIDVARWREAEPALRADPLLAHLSAPAPAQAPALPVGPEAAHARVMALVCRVLRLAPERLDPSRPLQRLGLDSLMALELKNRLEAETGVVVPVVRLLDGMSAGQLAGLVLERLAAPAPAPVAPAKPARLTPDEARALLARVDELPPEQVDELLALLAEEEG